MVPVIQSVITKIIYSIIINFNSSFSFMINASISILIKTVQNLSEFMLFLVDSFFSNPQTDYHTTFPTLGHLIMYGGGLKLVLPIVATVPVLLYVANVLAIYPHDTTSVIL
jgi:hypothetical protein